MYVLAAPCILDPSCRAHGITTAEDVRSFGEHAESVDVNFWGEGPDR